MRWTGVLLLARHFSSSFHYLSAIWFKSTFQTETQKCCTEKNSLEDAICAKLGITVSQIVKDFDNYDEREDSAGTFLHCGTMSHAAAADDDVKEGLCV